MSIITIKAASAPSTEVTNPHLVGQVASLENLGHASMVVSVDESRAFVDALLDPPPNNDSLRDSLWCYPAGTGG